MNNFSQEGRNSEKAGSGSCAKLEAALNLIREWLEDPIAHSAPEVDQACELVCEEMETYVAFLLRLYGIDPSLVPDVVNSFWVVYLTEKLALRWDRARMPFMAPFVFGILRRVTLEAARKFRTIRTRMKPICTYEPFDERIDPAVIMERDEIADFLHRAIKTLSSDYAEALMSRFFFTPEAVNCSANVRYLRTHRANTRR